VTGSRLGPYEITAKLGEGGMGEVYRARDTRLGRDVAIKVLRSAVTNDPDRLRRFQQEARAAAALDHPNILAIHDIGLHEGSPYIVEQLLEGRSLKERLSGGALPPRKAVEIGVAIAHGLSAAHAKGIVHRDLKPENVFITSTGVVKILDFGLAKLTQGENDLDLSVLPTGSAAHTVLGTAGYMAPEQVRGLVADHRADIFAFGCVLYEMLAGARAFRRDTAADTFLAILRDEPLPLTLSDPVGPVLDGIVRRCLEKQPEDRFQSARDLGFALEALASPSNVGPTAAPMQRRSSRARKVLGPLVVGGLVGLALIAHFAFTAGERTARHGPPKLTRLTFQRGVILSARFTSDGETVIYSASWEGRPFELFALRLGDPEARPLGITNADLSAISPSGELALIRRAPFLLFDAGLPGMLATVPMSGGMPREVEDNVHAAEWMRSGEMVVEKHLRPDVDELQLPLGHKVFDYIGTSPRVSPDREWVAVGRNDLLGGRAADLVIVDARGQVRSLGGGWASISALAWRSNDEIWISAEDRSGATGLFAVTRAGARRELLLGDNLLVQDFDAKGRLLATRQVDRSEVRFRGPGERVERDLSWLDGSQLADLSGDGRMVLFSEVGEGGGRNGSAYVRPSTGEAATRLAEGDALALSADGRWALVAVSEPQYQLSIVPLGAGRTYVVPMPSFPVKSTYMLRAAVSLAGTAPRFVVAVLTSSGERKALLVGLDQPTRDLGGIGDAVALAAAPDGRSIALGGLESQVEIRSLAGDPSRQLPGTTKDDCPVQWSGDGRHLYLRSLKSGPVHIDRYDIGTGRREPWLQLAPDAATGQAGIWRVALSRDGASYAYDTERVGSSDLFLVDGLE
jgi:hypothetical protein